jgi:superfamily II DNA helicase RecQ
VSEADVALAVQNQTGKMPRDWQMEAGLKPMKGEDVFVVARTGAGKSLIFMVTAMAARLAGLDGCLIVVSPLKTLQNDQVSEKDSLHGKDRLTAYYCPGNINEHGGRRVRAQRDG